MDSSAARFVVRHGLDGFDAALVADVTCGLHSGLPDCCVLFYVTFWQAADDARRAWYRRYMKYSGLPEYVPCPACLASGVFVEVAHCVCEYRKVRSRIEQEKCP